MANNISPEDRRKNALAAQYAGALWLGPICLSLCLSDKGPWWARGIMLIAACGFLSIPVLYHRWYGVDLLPHWPWKLIESKRPDLAFSAAWTGWFVRFVGVLGFILGTIFAAWLVGHLLKGPWTSSHRSLCLSVGWICTLLLTTGFTIVTARTGVFIYRDSRTVTIWWGLVWPMFRKSFRFDDFSDVVVFQTRAAQLSFSHWRVWLRESTNSVTLRARGVTDAARIADQLSEVIEVPRWQPDPKAGNVGV